MRNLNRSSRSVSPIALQGYHRAQLADELASRRQQVDDLWQQLQASEAELAQQKDAAEQAAVTARRRHQENETLLQRLMNAIRSRNSMRGRLGNMTMQRNRALRQVEKLTQQNRDVMEQLKYATDKLGEAYQQVIQLQTEYDQDMAELAQAYRALGQEQRATLPQGLRSLLDQIEQDSMEPNSNPTHETASPATTRL